jgi:hypothetical protein
MITDYLNRESVSKMTFEEFKTLLKSNPNLALRLLKDGYTSKLAFKELGGMKKESKKRSSKNISKKEGE